MKLKKTLLRGLLVLAAAAGIVCDSKYHLRLTEYELRFENLPDSFDGFRIVQLSDLHGARFGRSNAALVEMVAGQVPDLIALTGDFADSMAQAEYAAELVSQLRRIAPVFWVNGNHEWAGGIAEEIVPLIESRGAVCLENDFVVSRRGGERILIVGAEDPNGPADMIKPDALIGSIRREYPGDFLLLLGHRNYWLRRWPELDADLVLSGHAHGGIIRLPLVGGLLNTDHSFLAEYESGVYEGENFTMLVSRGLGNSIPVPRIFNRPEVVSLTLRSR